MKFEIRYGYNKFGEWEVVDAVNIRAAEDIAEQKAYEICTKDDMENGNTLMYEVRCV